MTEPYYKDDSVTLYLARWQDVEHWQMADVLITDPPYGMAYASNSSKRGPTPPVRGDDDTSERDGCLAAWGPDRPALVFGTWRVARPRDTRQLLVWDKGLSPGMGDLSLPWGPGHEEIYLLGGAPADWNPRPRMSNVIRSRQREGTGKAVGLVHPTAKPVYLMQALITATTGAVIADPFAGTGATLVAAKLLGRRAIGVEMDPRYCEEAASRLARIP